MDSSHFQSQMARLFEQYGKTAYGTERTRLLWQEFSHVSNSDFTEIVDYLLMTCATIPLLQKFLEAATIVSEKTERSTNRWSERTDCRKCNGYGVYFKQRPPEERQHEIEADFAYRCDCGARRDSWSKHFTGSPVVRPVEAVQQKLFNVIKSPLREMPE